MALSCPCCDADLHEHQLAIGPKADIRRCPVCQAKLQPRLNGVPFLFAWGTLAIPSLAVLYLLSDWGPAFDEVIGRLVWLDDGRGAAASCVAVISLVIAAVWAKRRDRHPSLALQTPPSLRFWAGLALIVIPVAVVLYVAITGDPSPHGLAARLTRR